MDRKIVEYTYIYIYVRLSFLLRCRRRLRVYPKVTTDFAKCVFKPPLLLSKTYKPVMTIVYNPLITLNTIYIYSVFKFVVVTRFCII